MARALVKITGKPPVGSVLPISHGTVPADYLVCDGSAVSRTTYSALFAIIGITHGQGDGSLTFNVPDYRGRFLRGTDGAAGRDPDSGSRTAMATGANTGNTVGSVQGHQISSHTHFNILAPQPAGAGDGVPQSSQSGQTQRTSTMAAAGGNETRPVNANVNYIIYAGI